ncbi:hypothetical protein IE53DRAFT_362704 [Violaceomyces palustris]|uniref:Uncharacterized protein n=1 Tax=Violaceomyces palustris TaxID=1673888 RepID=A0ACD0NVX7_9BASI|nr:hypothetical protein IE53DRAFT_362704 [Violaceomyces palustris]
MTSDSSHQSPPPPPPTAFQRLVIHTHDVARSLKPSSDGELAHSIHQTLHFSLDANEEDWGLENLIVQLNLSSSSSQPSRQADCGTSSSPSTSSNFERILKEYEDRLDRAVEEEEEEVQQHQRQQQQHHSKNGTSYPLPPSSSSSSSSSYTDQVFVTDQGERLKSIPGFTKTQDPNRPFVSYAWDSRTQTLHLPNPLVITNPIVRDPCSEANGSKRNDFEITAKFFYLSEGGGDGGGGVDGSERFPGEWIDQAMDKLSRTTGLITVDTLVVAFPTLDLDGRGGGVGVGGMTETSTKSSSSCSRGDCLSSGKSQRDAPDSNPSRSESEDEDRDQDLESVSKVWKHVSIDPRYQSLGLSDLSVESMTRLFEKLEVPEGEEYSIPREVRRPRVCTINVKDDPCSFDRSLSSWCNSNKVSLVTHNDRRDILPSRTLPILLEEFKDQLPHPLPEKGRLVPRWVLKYVTLIKERGVLADKGYICFAEVLQD